MGASTLDLEIRLRRGVPRVEFRLQVDWREMGSSEGVPNLRVRFPLDVHDPAPRYEIPFGSIRRDLVHGEEVPALRWADLSETDGQGVALANSSKYGFSVDGNSLSMTVLRASTEPDPLPDMGEHVVEYALEPHGAGWALSDSVGVGEEVNVPLAPLSCGFHPGELPAAMTAVSVEPANVRLAALKLAQQGRGMILRLYEVEGRDAEACVTLAPGLVADGASAEQVDMMERSVSENSARIDGHAVSVRVPAHGVAIVRVG